MSGHEVELGHPIDYFEVAREIYTSLDDPSEEFMNRRTALKTLALNADLVGDLSRRADDAAPGAGRLATNVVTIDFNAGRRLQ